PLADPDVPDRAARGTVDTPEGRLLPRWALPELGGGDRPLRSQLQARADQPGKSGAGRVLEVAIDDEMAPHQEADNLCVRLLASFRWRLQLMRALDERPDNDASC